MILAGALALAASTCSQPPRRRLNLASPAAKLWARRPDPAAAGAVDREGLQLNPHPLVLASLAYQATVVSINHADAAVAGAPRRRRQDQQLSPAESAVWRAAGGSALLGETVTLSDVLGGAAGCGGLGVGDAAVSVVEKPPAPLHVHRAFRYIA